MSDNVSAAIQGPTARWVEPQPDSGAHKRAMPGHWVIEHRGAIVDRAAPSAEVERLRTHVAEAEDWGRGASDNADRWFERLTVAELEVERLRAEREALHSDEMRTRIAWALAKSNGSTWDADPDDEDDIYRRDADAVLSVLLPRAEETR